MKSPLKERPIQFEPEMVKAIFRGEKSQTRRAIKPRPFADMRCAWIGSDGRWRFATRRGFEDMEADWRPVACPFGEPGDRLWVRETWRCNHVGGIRIEYKAGGKCLEHDEWPDGMIPLYVIPTSVAQVRRTERQMAGEKIADAWRTSIHLPRWASRLLLEITEIRVQKLRDISAEDAIAEGHDDFFYGSYFPDYLSFPAAVANFRRFWDATQGRKAGCSWADNPWVWAIGFRVIES